MNLRHCWAILTLLLGFSAAPGFAAGPCLRIGVPTGGAYAHETATLVVTIFARANICADAVLAPQARIDLWEEQGVIDGDAWRDEHYLAAKPELVRPATPVQHFSVSLYWRNGSPEPSGDNQMIGVLAGRSWAKLAIADHAGKIFEAGSYPQLILLAHSGRIQGFVMPTLTFEKLSAETGAKSGFASREIVNQALFLALHRRHAALLPAIDMAIKSLWTDGTISDRPSLDRGR